MTTTQTIPAPKKNLLDVAQRLMLAQGYAAVSVGAICEAAGVTKGSFFHYFKSKEALGLELLAYYWANATQRIQTELARAPERSAAQKAFDLIDFFANEAQQGGMLAQGCLVGHFAQSLSESHPTIRETTVQYLDEWRDLMSAILREALAENPSADFDPDATAVHFIVVLEGTLILAKAKGDPSLVQIHAEQFKTYLRCLLA